MRLACHSWWWAALLRLKQAAGRPQDLADIAELRLLHGETADG